MTVELTGDAKDGLLLMLKRYDELAKAVVVTHDRMEYVAKRLKKLEAQVAKLRTANAPADGSGAPATDTLRRDVRLWCPDCDRETDHDVSGLPVAECRDCLEPHDMTEAEICKANHP